MRFSTSLAAVAGATAAAVVLVPSAFAGNGIGVGLPALPAAPAAPALGGIAAVAPKQNTAKQVTAKQVTTTLKVPVTVVQLSTAKPVKAKHLKKRAICSRRLATAVSTVLPVDGVFTNTCTAEEVVVTGTQNMVVDTAVDGNGKGHVYIQNNWQKTSGVALLTGTKYSANDATHSFEREYVPGAENTILVQDEFELISNAPTPNLIVRSKIEIVVDADGIPIRINSAQVTADCRG